MQEHAICPTEHNENTGGRPIRTCTGNSSEITAISPRTTCSCDSLSKTHGESPPTPLSIPAPSRAATLSADYGVRTDGMAESRPTWRHGRVKWKQTWKVPSAIIGFYLLSFACAIAHYCFFRHLDGRLISEPELPPARTTSIPQSYVTIASLVIVTAFRAAIISSVGTCYTQYLWATLRRQTLKLHIIEDLFQTQNNAFLLTNWRLYVQPRLFTLAIIAAFCWLVPVATIYPPGALIVGSQAVTYATSFSVPTFHWDPIQDPYEERLNMIGCGESFGAGYWPQVAQNASMQTPCDNNINNEYIPEDIDFITSSSFISGEISRLYSPSTRDSSYNLSFWGNSLDCENYNITLNRQIQAGSNRFDWGSLSSSNLSDFHFSKSAITYTDLPQQERDNVLRYYPCMKRSENFPIEGVTLLINLVQTVCRPKVVRYHVTIAHAGSVQHVSYTLEEAESIPQYTETFKTFNGSFLQWVQLSDTVIPYAIFSDRLNRSYVTYTSIDGDKVNNFSEPGNPYYLENGTVIETCRISPTGGGTGWVPNSEVYKLSVFWRRRPQTQNAATSVLALFDPTIAKELLINTTISMLSLNARFRTVNGTETRDFNIYRFEHKLTFFLPYGLCLVLALPILALGLVALYIQNNGTSAISGGFLQLLMTTTGRTAVETVLAKGSGTLGGHENVSRELKEMEVRFGELVGDTEAECKTSVGPSDKDGKKTARDDTVQTAGEDSQSVAATAGFGTGDEVRPLRRRVAAARRQKDDDA